MDSAAWDERYAGSDSLWSLSPNQWVKQLVDPIPPGRAIDIAAGEGRNALWLVEQGWQVRATDFSPVAIDRLRERAKDLPPKRSAALRSEVSNATAGLMRSERGAYDLALMCYLHLPPVEWATAVRAAVTRTSVGGHTLIIGHSGSNLTIGVGGPQQRVLLYDPSEVLAVVDDLPVKAELADVLPREVPDEIRSALDTVVLLRRVS